jgi:hypothetical protein
MLGIVTSSNLCRNFLFVRSRDSSVGIVTGYELDGRGSIPGRGMVFFYSVQTSSGVPSDSYPMDIVIKPPGRDALTSV